MPLHKGPKSRLVTTADVVLQQLLIGQSCAIPQTHRPAKVLDNPAQLSGRHITSLVTAKLALYLTTTGSRPFDPPFFGSGARVAGQPAVAADGTGITAFRSMMSLQPAPLLNFFVRPSGSPLFAAGGVLRGLLVAGPSCIGALSA
jgi:hypothetical protein